MAGTTNRRKWRNILIHPEFQLHIALTHCAFVAAVVMILAASLLCTFYLDVQGSDDLWTRYVSAELLLRVFGRFGTAIVLIVIISFIYHIVFSHRLCGPLVNMRHTLDEITQGNLTRRVFLRRTDFLKEEATAINAMLGKMNNRIWELKQIQEEALSEMLRSPASHREDRVRVLLLRQQTLLEQWTIEAPSLKQGNEAEKTG
jgi:methyl-accepting chemotaxis protein